VKFLIWQHSFDFENFVRYKVNIIKLLKAFSYLLGWILNASGFRVRCIYLWRKVVSLFCFVCTYERSTEPGCLTLHSWSPLEGSGGIPLHSWSPLEGLWSASAWFHDNWTSSAKVLEYWMISSLKISEVLEMCFWCCWKGLDKQGLMEFYLVRFGFRMWETLIFKVISATENSI
jgi:hypothetical protein